MGLPMYKDPDDEQVIAEAAATKLDRAAATRRSTIRREPTVRLRESLTAAQGLARLIRDRRRGTSTSQDRTDTRIAQLQAELESLRRTRLEIVEGLERNSQRTPLSPPFGESQSINDGSDRDSATENAMEPADVVSAHLPQPPRESNLRFELSQSSYSPWSPGFPSRRTIPSPPYSSGSGEQRDHSIPDGPLLDDNSMPALTEGFAPAHSAPTTTSSSHRVTLDDEAQLGTPPPEVVWERERDQYFASRRANHMAPPPPARVDGLGDRRRSPSPISDSHEEETWATLLTEMNTDRASTSTSFASTVPDSRTRSGRTSQNTSTSFGEIGSTDDTCDLDLPPGITEEDVQEMRARHRPRETDRMTGRRGLQEHQDRIAGRVEVSMFRAILDRMHRRQDVPDEWWATVGLSPEFGRTLE